LSERIKEKKKESTDIKAANMFRQLAIDHYICSNNISLVIDVDLYYRYWNFALDVAMSSDRYRTVYIKIYHQQIKVGNSDLYSLNQDSPNVL